MHHAYVERQTNVRDENTVFIKRDAIVPNHCAAFFLHVVCGIIPFVCVHVMSSVLTIYGGASNIVLTDMQSALHFKTCNLVDPGIPFVHPCITVYM